jgi:DeoR/GlpR family transcriptional regulator of sugar metabolism
MTDDEQQREEPVEPQGASGCDVGEAGACQRTYAGVKRGHNTLAKGAIGRYVASELIGQGRAVLLDAGSTVEAVAQSIFERERRDGCLNLTIMTNNMGIWRHFNVDGHASPSGTDREREVLPSAHSLDLLLTGGKYDRQHDALFGSLACRGIEAFNPHVVVIGTSGFTFDDKGGLYYHGHTEEEVVKAAMWKKGTEHRIIVCDHTKMGRKDSFLGGKIEDLVAGAKRCTIVTTSPELEPRSGEPDDRAFKRVKAEGEAIFNQQKEAFDRLRTKAGAYPLTLVRLEPQPPHLIVGYQE